MSAGSCTACSRQGPSKDEPSAGGTPPHGRLDGRLTGSHLCLWLHSWAARGTDLSMLSARVSQEKTEKGAMPVTTKGMVPTLTSSSTSFFTSSNSSSPASSSPPLPILCRRHESLYANTRFPRAPCHIYEGTTFSWATRRLLLKKRIKDIKLEKISDEAGI